MSRDRWNIYHSRSAKLTNVRLKVLQKVSMLRAFRTSENRLRGSFCLDCFYYDARGKPFLQEHPPTQSGGERGPNIASRPKQSTNPIRN